MRPSNSISSVDLLAQSSPNSPFIHNVLREEGLTIEDVKKRIIHRAKESVHPGLFRIREEYDLFTQQWFSISISVFFLTYIVLQVCLNLSYYRYEHPLPEGKRLKDLGHELVPEISKQYAHLTDLPLTLLYVLVGILIVGSAIRACYFRKARKQLASLDSNEVEDYSHPYVVNMIRRFGVTYSIGNFLRAITYIVTSIPGGAEKCLYRDTMEASRPSVGDIFIKTASVEANCGDLMFSGHIMLCVLLCLLMNRYSRAGLGVDVSYVGFFLTFIQCFLILSARHHYSSDVVAGVYVTYLFWYRYTMHDPDDLKPDSYGIAKCIINGGKWYSRWTEDHVDFEYVYNYQV